MNNVTIFCRGNGKYWCRMNFSVSGNYRLLTSREKGFAKMILFICSGIKRTL